MPSLNTEPAHGLRSLYLACMDKAEAHGEGGRGERGFYYSCPLLLLSSWHLHQLNDPWQETASPNLHISDSLSVYHRFVFVSSIHVSHLAQYPGKGIYKSSHIWKGSILVRLVFNIFWPWHLSITILKLNVSIWHYLLLVYQNAIIPKILLWETKICYFLKCDFIIKSHVVFLFS